MADPLDELMAFMEEVSYGAEQRRQEELRKRETIQAWKQGRNKPATDQVLFATGLVAPERFRYTRLSDLYELPDNFEWLVEGLWVAGSYGQLAGQMKTLKSYLAMMISIGVGGGLPVLGTFDVPIARPVVYYVGEGGVIPWRRRLDRLARAMGAREPANLPIYPVFDAGPILSAEFGEGLRRNLTTVQPGLVVLDPLYAYHGTTATASNLHEEGALLSALSGPCADAGAALIVVNHFAKTSQAVNLASITMAGGGEHSDSWILVGHRVFS